MKTAIIYARLSVEREGEIKHSIETQLRVCNDFCKRHGYQVAATFQDRNRSGKDFAGRKAWQNLLTHLKADKVDAVVMRNLDRFTRNVYEGHRALQQLKKLGVELLFVEGDYDMATATGKLRFNIEGAFSQHYRDTIAEKTRNSLDTIRAKGGWVGPAPLGYDNARTGDNLSTLQPNEKAELVRAAFEMKADGHSTAEVRRWLAGQGVNVSDTRIYLLFSNKAYLGKLPLYTKTDKPEWIEGQHPAIVPESVWYAAQKTGIKQRRKKDAPDFPLKGLLVCPHGKPMTASRSRSKHGYKVPYYHCHGSHSKPRENVNAERLHQQVTDILKSIKVDPAMVTLYQKIVGSLLEQEQLGQRKRKGVLQAAISKEKQFQERLHQDYYDGNLVASIYNEQMQRSMTRLHQSERELDTIQQLTKALKADLTENWNWLADLHMAYHQADLKGKQAILGSTFPNGLRVQEKRLSNPRVNSCILMLMQISRRASPENVGDFPALVPFRELMSNPMWLNDHNRLMELGALLAA